MGSRHSKKKREHAVDDGPEELCHLLVLSLDVWNHHLCRLLTAKDYNTLWRCGDSRLNARLTNLRLEAFMLESSFEARLPCFPLLLQLLASATVYAYVGTRSIRLHPIVTAAPKLTIGYRSCVQSFDFSACPNLRSLRLCNNAVDARSVHFFMSELLGVLPPTVTELVSTSKAINRFGPNAKPLDPVVFSTTVSQRLPHLLTLEINTHSVLAPSSPSSPDQQCVWPKGLTSLSLILRVTHAGQCANLNFPPRLTLLRLMGGASVNGRDMIVKTSFLPSTLAHLHARALEVLCDAAFPVRLETLECLKVTPGYEALPFALPSTLTFMKPCPPVSHVDHYPANVRILAHLDDPDRRITSVGPEDAAEWKAYEQQGLSLSHISNAFTRPTFFDCRNRPALVGRLVPNELFPAFARRIGATVTNVAGVNLASLVVPLMTHCPWLKNIEFSDPAATRAFLRHLISSSQASAFGRPSVPSSLARISIDLRGSETVALIRSLALEHARVVLGNVTTLSVPMNLTQLVDAHMCLALAHLFPNVNVLRVWHVNGEAGNGKPLSATHVNVLLNALPRLCRFNMRCECDSVTLSEREHAFFGKLAPHVATITVKVSEVEMGRARDEFYN